MKHQKQNVEAVNGRLVNHTLARAQLIINLLKGLIVIAVCAVMINRLPETVCIFVVISVCAVMIMINSVIRYSTRRERGIKLDTLQQKEDQ